MGAHDAFCQRCGAPARARSDHRRLRVAAGVLALVSLIAWIVAQRPSALPPVQSEVVAVLTDDDRLAWQALIEQTRSPQVRPTVVRASIPELRSGAMGVDFTVVLSGVVVAAEDGQWGSLLRVAQGPETLLVAWPGRVGPEIVGRPVSLRGQYLGQGVFADTLEVTTLSTRLLSSWVAIGLLLAAGVLVQLLLIFAAIRLVRRKRGGDPRAAMSPQILVLTLLSVVLTSGCSVDVAIEITEDGRGQSTTSIQLTPQERQQLRQLPNVASYLDAWRRTLERSGLQVLEMNLAEGRFVFRRMFDSVLDLSSEEGGITRTSSWVHVESRQRPLETTWEFVGKFDTRDLLPEASVAGNPSLRAELHRRLRHGTLTYRVRLPGSTAEPGSSQRDASYTTITVPLGEVAVLHATGHAPRQQAKRVLATLFGGLGVTILASLFWILNMMRRV